MTDEEIIKQGLIELLIRLMGYDMVQAELVRKAREDDSKDELLAQIREWLDHQERIAELMENTPETMRTFLQKIPT